MKIVKGAERSEVHWTARKIVEMFNNGEINADIDIQRPYVWKDNDKRSALIRSLILDRAVPPLYFNKDEDVYEVEDGKQRIITTSKFMNDEFSLSGLELIPVMSDSGEMEEFDINGLKFSELIDVFQNAIKEYSFIISFTNNADAEEVADTFYNLNNGQGMNAATMNRSKAKSKGQISRLGKHDLFKECLSDVALNGHVNEDLVVKTHAILYDAEPSMDTTWIRPYMRNVIITENESEVISSIFDRIKSVYGLIEDKKVAKRLYTKTHMISVVAMIKRSIDEGRSDEDVMQWFCSFFCGKKSATLSTVYNSAAGSGSGKKDSVRKRLNETEKSYVDYFSKN